MLGSNGISGPKQGERGHVGFSGGEVPIEGKMELVGGDESQHYCIVMGMLVV